MVSTPVAGFRDSDDPRVVVAGSDDFPAVVAGAVPATTAFPVGVGGETGNEVRGETDDWQDRVMRMRAVLDRLVGPDRGGIG
ncbi:hypothetical protein SDC9_133802 [bioreactor metagenome]|uniref:Uncharacterized protein n=1 Tax=bioreactor metagenome TaxID=1076179 RepID=A0A645DBL7_9ZZZZ